MARESAVRCFRASAITIVYDSKSSFNVSMPSFQIIAILIQGKFTRGASLIAVKRTARQRA